MNIRLYKDFPAGYDDEDPAEETAYMDHPYEATCQDERGVVSRGCFRYLGDASLFVGTACRQEVNPCLWRIKNRETGLLISRWRYHNGQATPEVGPWDDE